MAEAAYVEPRDLKTLGTVISSNRAMLEKQIDADVTFVVGQERKILRVSNSLIVFYHKFVLVETKIVTSSKVRNFLTTIELGNKMN